MEVIRVNGLNHSYDHRLVLNGLEFAVERGEIFGLLGENGAGKSTTIAILTSQLKPTSGKVSVLGLDPLRRGNTLKSKIGLAAHELRLTGNQPANETLAFYGSLYGISGAELGRRVDELLEMVELRDRASEIVKNLSEGMKRRLNLALALVHDPELVFLDEPTLALDPGSRHHIWQLIRSLKRQGKTVFLTTHLMEEAEYLCDRVAILDGGRIVEVGRPADLKDSFVGGKIIDIEMDCSPSIVEELEPIAGKGNVVCEGGLYMITKEPEKNLQDIMLRYVNQGIGRILVREPSLEDVFLRLTGKKLVNGNAVTEEVRKANGNTLVRRVFFWKGRVHRITRKSQPLGA